MAFYHVLALRSRNKTKLIYNRTETQVLTDYVIPFLQNGAIQTIWRRKAQVISVADMEVYKTEEPYNKTSGVPFDKFKRKKKNIYPSLAGKAKRSLSKQKTRVFVIMPIQGEEQGSSEEQRIYREYETRFEVINEVLNELDCFGIRIDKEYPLDELVKRIKNEIEKAQFLIADLTDERPSCYFEAGYGEGRARHIIYVASDNSVIDPKEETKIHFDIHKNVQFFRNHSQLKDKVRAVFNKNKGLLLSTKESEMLAATQPSHAADAPERVSDG